MVQTNERIVERAPTTTALSLDAFSAKDWALLTATALTWGSSFVWIDIALNAFHPTLITLLRITFGMTMLALVPKARTPVARADLRPIAVLGLLWIAFPMLLFATAQQWIDSSLAGMVNGAMPIFAAIVSAIMLRRMPPAKALVGIGIGFVGVLAVTYPAAQGSSATLLGVALVTIATICYGISVNIAAPLQQRYGSLSVVLRAQMVAFGLILIPGLIGATDSSFEWTSLAALVPLGCLGTGLAFVWMSTLVGRVGAARGSVTIYFVPVVAIVMGAAFRSESIAALSLAGTALVIVGAFLASRSQRKGS